jgi:hypothetical protein
MITGRHSRQRIVDLQGGASLGDEPAEEIRRVMAVGIDARNMPAA